MPTSVNRAVRMHTAPIPAVGPAETTAASRLARRQGWRWTGWAATSARCALPGARPPGAQLARPAAMWLLPWNLLGDQEDEVAEEEDAPRPLREAPSAVAGSESGNVDSSTHSGSDALTAGEPGRLGLEKRSPPTVTARMVRPDDRSFDDMLQLRATAALRTHYIEEAHDRAHRGTPLSRAAPLEASADGCESSAQLAGFASRSGLQLTAASVAGRSVATQPQPEPRQPQRLVPEPEPEPEPEPKPELEAPGPTHVPPPLKRLRAFEELLRAPTVELGTGQACAAMMMASSELVLGAQRSYVASVGMVCPA
jgi:hypothetical protein